MTLATLAPRRPTLGTSPDPAVGRRRLPVRTLVVHQADVVRAGVASLVTAAGLCETTGVASAFEAFRIAQTVRPDMILFEFRPGEGPEATRLLATLWPRPRLVALVGPRTTVGPEACLRAGADAAIATENVSGSQFLTAVQHAIDGRSPAVAGFPRGAPDAVEPALEASLIEQLTPREREILFVIGDGLSNKEIAESFALSVKTVETHRANLSRKLNIRPRAGLIRFAIGIRLGAAATSAHRPEVEGQDIGA